VQEDPLRVLGLVAASLAPERLDEGLDEALETLRTAVGCDSIALYLADPPGRELYLTACAGVASFPERCAVGQGIPGLTALDGEALVVEDARRNARFRATPWGPPGLGSYLALPLRCGHELMGVLQAAWSRAGGPDPGERNLLELASIPIRTVVQASLLALRKAVADVFTRKPRDVDGALRDVLRRMQDLTHVQAAAAFFSDGSREWKLTDRLDTPCGPTDPFFAGACPYVHRGGPIVLSSGNPRIPERCHLDERGGGCRTCFSLPMDGDGVGAVRLSYATPPPQPPTRYVAALEAMADETAQHLRAALTPGGPVVAPASPALRPAMLEIRCLGRFEVLREGQPVPASAFKRGTALQVLKILLLNAGNPVGRDALCELLWPGSEPAAAANRLHGAIHALRHAIEPRAAERQWLFVCGFGEQYWFNLGAPHRVDFLELKALLARARGLQDDPTQAIQILESACDLYRGDLFEDEPYAEWCWPEREALRERYQDALFTLARLRDEQGDTARSLEHFRAVLRANPLREDVHCALIDALWRWGRRAEAVAQYEECVEVLQRELDAEPLPETRRVGERITASLR